MFDTNALIQGLTEFLPVSSSLHLELWAKWQNITLSKDQEVSLHIGTLIALCGYFLPQKKWPSFKTLCYVAVATLPAMVVGFYLKKVGFAAPASWLPYSTILGGLCLLLAEDIGQKRKPQSINVTRSFLIGLAQILAFIPGASRMGTTVTMARLMGVSVHESLNFSWLLAIPTVGGAVALTLWDTWKAGQALPIQTNDILTTALVGWCVLVLVGRYANSVFLKICAYYRIALGLRLVMLS